MTTAIVYSSGPSGKTFLKESLCKIFGCNSVVDEWTHNIPLKEGALHLTNTPINNPPSFVVQMHMKDVLECIASGRSFTNTIPGRAPKAEENYA